MIIFPYVSVGELSFLDSRKGIQTKINLSFTSGVKEFEGIQDFYDHFTEIDLLVYYDKLDNVTAFEFYSGYLLFENISLFDKSYKYLFDFFSSIVNNINYEFTGFNSEKFGIVINAPEAIDNNLVTPESIFVYRKGYYDD